MQEVEQGLSVHSVERWMLAQAVLWILVCALSLRYDGAFVLAAPLVLLSYAALWVLLGAGRTVADWITGSRLVLLCAVFASCMLEGEISGPAWFVLCFAAFADLADGWAARRWGGTPGGAILDMEADQFSLLIFAICAHALDGAGFYVFALPAFRYLYVLGMGLRGFAIHDPKPLDGDNRRAKTICAIVVISLLAMLCPYLMPEADFWLAVLAIALIAFSYASDVVQLFARRA